MFQEINKDHPIVINCDPEYPELIRSRRFKLLGDLADVGRYIDSNKCVGEFSFNTIERGLLSDSSLMHLAGKKGITCIVKRDIRTNACILVTYNLASVDKVNEVLTKYKLKAEVLDYTVNMTAETYFEDELMKKYNLSREQLPQLEQKLKHKYWVIKSISSEVNKIIDVETTKLEANIRESMQLVDVTLRSLQSKLDKIQTNQDKIEAILLALNTKQQQPRQTHALDCSTPNFLDESSAMAEESEDAAVTNEFDRFRELKDDLFDL